MHGELQDKLKCGQKCSHEHVSESIKDDLRCEQKCLCEHVSESEKA